MGWTRCGHRESGHIPPASWGISVLLSCESRSQVQGISRCSQSRALCGFYVHELTEMGTRCGHAFQQTGPHHWEGLYPGVGPRSSLHSTAQASLGHAQDLHIRDKIPVREKVFPTLRPSKPGGSAAQGLAQGRYPQGRTDGQTGDHGALNTRAQSTWGRWYGRCDLQFVCT